MATTKSYAKVPEQGLKWEDLTPGKAYIGESSRAVYYVFESFQSETKTLEKQALVLYYPSVVISGPDKYSDVQSGTFTEYVGKIEIDF